jgi:hypothetical protein
MLRCNYNKENEVAVTSTRVATQDIDVTGTQDMDQTNTCDDDDLGIPGEIECINEASAPEGLGNSFLSTCPSSRCVSRIVRARYQSGKYMFLV